MLPLHILMSLNRNNIDWQRIAGTSAAAVIVVLLLYVRLQSIALKRDDLVYKNPRMVQQVRVVRLQGPVRVVTRTIREPGGREEVVREEIHAPVTEIRDVTNLSEPVFPPAPRSSRWLAGAAITYMRNMDKSGYTIYGGYSFTNRLDLCLGLTGSGRPAALVMLRF